MRERRQQPISCEHCGSDKWWNVSTWLYERGKHFCSRYCVQNYASADLRKAIKRSPLTV